MHLGYVVESFGPFIANEILELRRQGVSVTILSAFRPFPVVDPIDDALWKEALYLPRRYRRVLSANLRLLRARPAAYLTVARRLLREGESLRTLFLAGHLAELVCTRGIEHLHATYATRTSTVAYAVARLAGVSWSFTTHAYDLFHANPSLGWKTREALFVRTISEFNKTYLLESQPGLCPGNIEVCYLGVDADRFQPVPAAGAAEIPLLLSVGWLAHKKGHAYLMGACRLLLDRGAALECLIVGEGPTRLFLEDRLRTLRLGPHVRLLGNLTHEEAWARFQKATLFVLACVDARTQGEDVDGIPVALMEAMAMGLAVVSTRVSGVPELIEDGVSGLLVAERDEEGLAAAIERLLRDPRLRRRLGEAARDRVLERFELRANTSRLAAAFRARLGGGEGGCA